MIKNEVLLAISPSDLESVEIAKKWIKDNGYTSDTVKLVRGDGLVQVIAL